MQHLIKICFVLCCCLGKFASNEVKIINLEAVAYAQSFILIIRAASFVV